MNRKTILALLAAGILCLPLSACGEKSARREFFAMDTFMSVTVYGRGAESAAESAEAEIRRCEALFSTTDPESAVSALNRSGGGETDAETRRLLSLALDIGAETEGAFDITIRPALRAWGFTEEAYRVPAAAELEALRPLVDYRKTELSGSRVTLGEGQEIDLGGIAKGYASDAAAALLRERGIGSALLYLGGSVQVIGTKPDGSPWRVGIQNPDGSDDYLGVVSAAGTAVVTSGAYQRYFEEGGVRYHHILDPATLAPAESGLASVTAVCPEAAAADGYSTALFVMGEEGAVAFWRERAERFDMVLCTEDGRLLVTEGLEDAFSSECAWEVLRP